MGLDIYFWAKSKENSDDKLQKVFYFRKVNFLVSWVSRNIKEVENCEHIAVAKEHVELLLENINNINKRNASDLLPTMSGFFFGNLDYDEYYWQDVEAVKGFCEEIIDVFDFENNKLIFEAWW